MSFNKAKILVLLLCFSCILQAQVKLISFVGLEVDQKYDSLANPKMQRLMTGYKTILEKKVSRVIGSCARIMTARAPESLLSNFLSDQLLAKANDITTETVDLSIINLGGIRAPLNEGSVTIESMYKIMPFENELVIVKLKGKDLRSVLENIAREGGEGVSNIKLEIKNGKINSLKIGNQPLDVGRFYVVATMEYLAEGNSGMTAFLNATERINTGIRVRDVYIEQIEKITARGEAIDASLDGRIKIIEK